LWRGRILCVVLESPEFEWKRTTERVGGLSPKVRGGRREVAMPAAFNVGREDQKESPFW
jgi:hypothetical protein